MTLRVKIHDDPHATNVFNDKSRYQIDNSNYNYIRKISTDTQLLHRALEIRFENRQDWLQNAHLGSYRQVEYATK